MSVWRRKALALFPEDRVTLAGPDCAFRDFLRELESRAKAAHAAHARDPDDRAAASELRRIHGFAEWCLHQDALWEDTAIGFLENVFTLVPWDQLASWLSPFVIAEARKTWAFGFDGRDVPRFERALAGRTTEEYRATVYQSGEVERL